MAKNKLKCNVTGLWYGISAARRAKLVDKYGSFEALVDGYVSRDALRYRKEGKTDDEIRNLVSDGTISSNTAAPKRASTRGEVKPTKVVESVVSEAVTAVTEEAEDEIDPDVKAFLEDDEADRGDASDKAI